MISLIIVGGLLVMAVGLIAKLYLDKTEHELRIDRIELAIASAVLLLIVVPATTYVGVKMAVNSQVTFNENWGGFEVRVEKIVTPCHKDGSMRHSYKGDPEHKTRTVYYTDSKGKRKSRAGLEIGAYGVDGMTLEKIGEELGFTKEAAKKAIETAMERFKVLHMMDPEDREELVLVGVSD